MIELIITIEKKVRNVIVTFWDSSIILICVPVLQTAIEVWQNGGE